ncbi:MAG: hypothetical protein JWM80_3331 [Cyanobacteria bacterium RYN_339]|nr:hypothetical protein [Cyanobacteria bacterium RYN_339]
MNFKTTLQTNFNRFALSRGANTSIIGSGGGNIIGSGGGNVISNGGAKLLANNCGNLTLPRDAFVRSLR